jgi:hypothetical protein
MFGEEEKILEVKPPFRAEYFRGLSVISSSSLTSDWDGDIIPQNIG